MGRRELIAGLLRLMACFPLPLVHALGYVVGSLLSLFPNKLRRIAVTNLKLCFPDLPPSDRRRLLRQSLRETSKAMLELGPLWLWEGKRILDLVRRVEGEETWRAAFDKKQGVIGITPHLGAWEMIGLYISSRYPTTTLYRPSRLDIDAIARTGRERLGAQMVPTNAQGVRALLQGLRQGRAIGILPDQDPGADNGIFAPFFGHAANTMVLLSKLAIKSQVPVFLVYAERLAWGRGYRLHFSSLPDTVNNGSLEESVIAVNQAVEQAVRRLPSQYLWAYKRFKTRPQGIPRRY